MAARIVARTSQPRTLVRINRANRFGARTQFFASDLGQLIDASTGRIPTISGVVQAVDSVGVVREIDTAPASPNYIEWPSNGIDLNSPFTMAVRAKRLTAGSGKYDRIFSANFDNTGNSRFGFLLEGSGEGANADKVYFFFVDGGGGVVQTYQSPAPVMSTTAYETYVVTHDGANLQLYLNGVNLGGSFPATTFPVAVLPGTLRIGNDQTPGNFNGAACRVQFAHIMRGALTDAEVLTYSANPWQVLSPPLRRRNVNAVAGGGTSVAITGVAGTGAVGNVTPSVSVALTGVGGTGAAGSVAPALSIGLTGNAGTGAAGSVAPAFTIPLTGVAGTGSVGTVTADTGTFVALTGVGGTGAAGSVSPAFSIALTGVEGLGRVGSLTLESGEHFSGGYNDLGGKFAYRRRSEHELEESRQRFGITNKAAVVIERVAEQQAEDLRSDPDDEEELKRELRLAKVRYEARHLEMLNERREQLINEELQARAAMVRDDNDLLTLVILSAGATL